jgi:hypothetical protein
MKHWTEIVTQNFRLSPKPEMITGNYYIEALEGAKRSTVPKELRARATYIYDISYVSTYFARLLKPLNIELDCDAFEALLKQAATSSESLTLEIGSQSSREFESFYQCMQDEITGFAALLPNQSGSRNPKDYTPRWDQAVRFLEKLENITKIEYQGKALTREEVKTRLGRLK